VSRYLITGVSRGIGLQVATGLIADGHQVIGVVRPGKPAPLAGFAGVWELELTEPASFADRLTAQLASLDSLDGVVHSAGIVRPGSLDEPLIAGFTDQFTVNVTAVAELTRLVLPALRAAGGTVVLVNSGSGLSAGPPLASYGASKYALRGYADALRKSEPLLRVSTVYPGRTATEMQKEVRGAEHAEYREADYLQPATVAGVIRGVLALPADGVITDVTLNPR
jgi:NAD(P)-dependent dehydrogenase (short-subunit alcohol dehydrogenase family)